MQEFMQEMSQMDEKVKSLVSFGFSESKAKMAITRCGMYQHWCCCKCRRRLMFMQLTYSFCFILILLRAGCRYICFTWCDLRFRGRWSWSLWELCKQWGTLWLNCSTNSKNWSFDLMEWHFLCNSAGHRFEFLQFLWKKKADQVHGREEEKGAAIWGWGTRKWRAHRW